MSDEESFEYLVKKTVAKQLGKVPEVESADGESSEEAEGQPAAQKKPQGEAEYTKEWLDEHIKKDAKIIEDLGADSLDIVELIMAIEEDFGVDVPDEVAEEHTTVADVIKYVQDHQN